MTIDLTTDRPEPTTPYDVLIAAKLAGTVKFGNEGYEFGYAFRTNEQAAAVALDALKAAGYTIVTKHDAWAAAQLLQGEAAAREVPQPNLVTRLRDAAE